ncbi:MAG: ATP-binding protein [Planctomycetota bacterium]
MPERDPSVRFRGSSKPWPLVLLLGGVVALPTGIVIWLLGSAFEEGQSALEDNLRRNYESSLTRIVQDLDSGWARRLDEVTTLAKDLSPDNASERFSTLVSKPWLDAAVIWSFEEESLYPASAPTEQETEATLWLKEVEITEFDEGDVEGALKAYRKLASKNSNPSVVAGALRGAARCLNRQGEKTAAIEALLDERWNGELRAVKDDRGRVISIDIALFALEVLKGDPKQAQSLAESLRRRLETYDASDPIHSRQRVFAASILEERAPAEARVENIAAERLALSYLEHRPESMEQDILLPSSLQGVWTLRVAGTIDLLLRIPSSESTARLALPFADPSALSEARWQIRSSTSPPPPRTFASQHCRGVLRGRRLDLELTTDDPLGKAAGELFRARLWTACLVLASTLLLAFALWRFVRRQLQVSRLKADWTATITHELRTPLAGIRTLVDTLQNEEQETSPEKMREYIALIASENERLSRLIENFLTYSRDERGTYKPRRSAADPEAIARRSFELFEHRARREIEGIDLELLLDNDLPEISADGDALVAVLLNLLENAQKYSGDEKRIRLRVLCSAGGDSADGRREGSAVRFEVEDNGHGIRPSEQKKIFDRFYQIDRRLARRSGGAGLGLSVVRTILEGHGTRIELTSEEGIGSTFAFELSSIDENQRSASER